MSIKTLLEVEIEEQLTGLASMERGSDEHKTAVDNVAKLMDRAIELEKLETASMEKEKDRAIENYLKQEQVKDERLDRIVKNCISVAGIVLPIALTVWGTKTSLKFEEDGTITTTIGRGFINKLLPKK